MIGVPLHQAIEYLTQNNICGDRWPSYSYMRTRTIMHDDSSYYVFGRTTNFETAHGFFTSPATLTPPMGWRWGWVNWKKEVVLRSCNGDIYLISQDIPEWAGEPLESEPKGEFQPFLKVKKGLAI